MIDCETLYAVFYVRHDGIRKIRWMTQEQMDAHIASPGEAPMGGRWE